jgi:hypothetical protein
MKKNVVMAVIATLALGQLSELAQAAGTGRTRPRAIEDARTETGRRGAERGGRAGADSAATTPFAQAKSMNLTRGLSPDQLTALSRKSEDPVIKETLKDIVELAKSGNAGLEEYLVARVRATANVPAGYNIAAKQAELDGMADGPAKENLSNELAYVKFALRSYTKDFGEANVANLTFLLNATDTHYANSGGERSGSLGASFKAGNDLMAKPTVSGGRATRLELKEANKYCK